MSSTGIGYLVSAAAGIAVSVIGMECYDRKGHESIKANKSSNYTYLVIYLVSCILTGISGLVLISVKS